MKITITKPPLCDYFARIRSKNGNFDVITDDITDIQKATLIKMEEE